MRNAIEWREVGRKHWNCLTGTVGHSSETLTAALRALRNGEGFDNGTLRIKVLAWLVAFEYRIADLDRP
jgi:hypothetical protein